MSGPRLRHVVALAFAVATLTGCSDHAIDEPELQRVSLPGFSIDLPAGRVQNASKEAFAGRHDVQLPDPGILRRLPFASGRRQAAKVSVSWNEHGLEDEEYSGFLRGVALKAIPNSTVLREATLAPGSWVLTIGGPKASVTYASHSCEPGFNVVLVVGVNTRANADFGLASKIIRSVACSLTDANRKLPEAATRLPPEFARVMGEKDPVYLSLAGESLDVSFTSGDIPGSPAFSTVITALVSQVTGVPPAQVVVKEIPVSNDDDRRHRLVGASAGETLLYEGALWCPNLGVTFMTTYTSTHPSDERAHRVFDSIYCPGEPGESPPDAKPILEAACTAGQSTACEFLKLYSF